MGKHLYTIIIVISGRGRQDNGLNIHKYWQKKAKPKKNKAAKDRSDS